MIEYWSLMISFLQKKEYIVDSMTNQSICILLVSELLDDDMLNTVELIYRTNMEQFSQ